MPPNPLLANPIFSQALTEIKALGLHISDSPQPGSTPYLVIGGRSNQRWWLIPLANRKVATSGMALFQPVLASAKIIKAVAMTAFAVGLSTLWARKKLHIAGNSCLAELMGSKYKDLYYAYFTGTDSPHRKTTVQIMERDGSIKGFAKITANPAVKPLLAHEAATLQRLHTIDLRYAHIPKVLFNAELGEARILLTDTLKTPTTKSSSELLPAHTAFLQELASKTSIPLQTGSAYAAALNKRLIGFRPRLTDAWQHRLQRAIQLIDTITGSPAMHLTLTHGDFTPWNTFIVDQKIYVFDWEYATHALPASADLIHFILAQPRMADQPPNVKLKSLKQAFQGNSGITTDDALTRDLMIYLTHHVLWHIDRLASMPGLIETWDGSDQSAILIDALLQEASQ